MSHSCLVWVCSVVYGVTLSCMTYAACADPGQLKAEKKSRKVEVGADIERGCQVFLCGHTTHFNTTAQFGGTTTFASGSTMLLDC